MAGQGRILGSKNKQKTHLESLARRSLALAHSKQITPLDVLTSRYTGQPMPNGKHPTDEQIQAAIAAAPYVHPRLASTDTTIKSDNVHRVFSSKPLTEAEWVQQHAPANDAVSPELPEDAEKDTA